MAKWKEARLTDDGSLGGIYTVIELVDGERMRVEFTANIEDTTDKDVTVSICIYRGRFNEYYAFHKQGESTGKYGIDALYPAIEAILDGETAITRRYPGRKFRIVLDAASPKLFRIYKRTFSRYGYYEAPGLEWNLNDRIMVKNLWNKSVPRESLWLAWTCD